MNGKILKEAFRIIRLILILVCVLVSSALTAFAFTSRTGESLTIGKGEVINPSAVVTEWTEPIRM